MISICLRKGNKKTTISVNKYKYLVGNNNIEKLKIIRLFDEFNTNLKEPKDSNLDTLKLFINEKQYTQKNLNIIKIDYNFALYQNFKLQANSLLLKSLSYKLSNNEYIDLFETIESVMESICDQFNEDSNIKIINPHFTYSQFLKLIEPKLIADDEIINEYNLSIKDFILLQLDIIKPVVENNNMTNIVIIDYPIIGNTIFNSINNISNTYFIIKCDYVNTTQYNIKDFMLINEFNFDLACEETIYDYVCCNILNNSNIEEGYKYMNKLITNKIYTVNLKTHN